jgi:hypothetical protein
MDTSKVIRVHPQLFKNTEKIKATHDFEGRNVRGFDGNYNKDENRFQAEMRLKPQRYGFHRVVDSATPSTYCIVCGEEINGAKLLVNGIPYHGGCFKSI